MHRPISRGVGSNMLLTNNIGDGSTLTLDFLSGILDTRLTMTRASNTATFIGSNGYVQTAVANQPRFDYDPVTLACRGLLIEGAATNLATYSEDYSQAVWTKNNVNRTTGQSSPDNQTGATLLEENTTAFVKHGIERSPTITPGVHTFSVWVKEPATNSRRYVCIQIADGQATAARYTIVADLQSGTITASGANNGSAGAPTNTSHSISAFVSGWYRLTITMNCVASPVYPAVMLSNISTLYGGNNQPFYSAAAPYLGLIVWGAQLETGLGASSYVPTTASTVIRNADQCELLNLSTMGFNSSAGTILTDVGARTNTGSNRNYTFLPAIGTNDQIFESSGTAFAVYTSGSFVAQIGTSTPSAAKICAAYAVNDFAVSVNGGAVSTDILGSPPTVLTKLTIGGTVANPAGYANGHIRAFRYWPFRLPNATLQSLSL